MLLNESLTIVAILGFERAGELVAVKEVLDDDRVLAVGRADDQNGRQAGRGAAARDGARRATPWPSSPKSG